MNRILLKPLVTLMSTAINPAIIAPIVTVSRPNFNYMVSTIKDENKNFSNGNQKPGQFSQSQKDQKDHSQKDTDKKVNPEKKDQGTEKKDWEKK